MNNILIQEKENQLTISDKTKPDIKKMFSFFEEEIDALGEIMLILTEGKTSTFDTQVIIDALNCETLLKAVKKNNLKLAKLCLISGLLPDGLPSDSFEKTQNLLAISIQNNYVEMMKLLLEYGANPNGNKILNNEGHPLLAAIEKENIDIVRLLLSKGATTHINILVSTEKKKNTTVQNTLTGEPIKCRNLLCKKYTSPLKKAIEIYYETEKHKQSEIAAFTGKQKDPNISTSPYMLSNKFVPNSSEIALSPQQPISDKNPLSNSLLLTNSDSLSLHQSISTVKLNESGINISPITEIILVLIQNNPQCLDNTLCEEGIEVDSPYDMDPVEIYEKQHALIAQACRQNDLDMVQFLIESGAKLRTAPQNEDQCPIIDIGLKTSQLNPQKNKKHEYILKDTSVSDEMIEAVKTGNAKLVEYLINQNAFVTYNLSVTIGWDKSTVFWGRPDPLKKTFLFARGIAEAIEKDDINIVSILMHHGVQLDNNVYFHPLNNKHKNEKIGDDRGDPTHIDRCITVNDILDDPSHPKIYAMYKENGFEKRYQMLQNIWKFEERIAQKKRLEAEQKMIEEDQKKLLENQKNDLIRQVNALPYETKIDPQGEDYLLIQKLALLGCLYSAAKEESFEVVSAWIPIFKRVIPKESLNQLMQLQECLERSNIRRIE